MKEVSAKALHVFFRHLRRKGVPVERIVEGTSVSTATLVSRGGRLEWSELAAIHRNLRTWFTDDELVDVGRSVFRAPALRFMFVIARLLLTPLGFYRWMNTPRKGAGNELFTCVTPHYRETGPDNCEIELLLPPGYEVIRDFFLLTRGSFEEAPRLLGYKRAAIDVEYLENGARFHVTIPKRTPLLTRLRRALAWPFTARAAARELQAAHEELVERYEQLEKTAGELEEYKNNLERMVDERTRQLREAQAARERFFGNISHEIRTPLSLILLATDDIERRAGPRLDASAKQGLVAVNEAARKLVRLVDELLLLAAGQEDKLKIHPEPTDLVQLVEHLAIAWRPAAEAAGLELVARTPGKLVASVDPVAIERVASNLVSNAIKYTPKGGRVEIELAIADDGQLRLSVLDTGAGIPEELASRLFGRFERAAGEDRRKIGTGIGLWLVKSLVEAHGGTIAALPRAGGGSELRALLPDTRVADIAAAHALRVGAPTARAALAAGSTVVPDGISAGTVLLAEDDTALAETIARLLGQRYTVIVAHDGLAAVELARQHRPHVLVTDVDMPGIDGIELARRFRDTVGDPLAPIVILSAVIDVRTRIEGLEAGAVDYVTKPFEAAELLARVDAQFRTRALAVRMHRAEQVTALGILSSGLAHELRNPANGIVNAIEPLRELLPHELTQPDTATGQLLAVVSECATHIGFLSRQLLGLRDGGHLEVREVRIAELVERALVLSTAALSGVSVRIKVEGYEHIRCAPHLLVQALTNLVENAGHAAGPGGWIEVRTYRESQKIAVEVSDSGPGVPPEIRERVFEPFFTTKPVGRGTGLGLAVALEVVRRHGGLLEIRDRDGKSRFVIELPDHSVSAKTANAV